MPTAIATLDLARMPAAVAFQRWTLFRGLDREAAAANLEVVDAVAGKHVAWRIRDLRRRSGLATFEALPGGGTRVYLQMAASDHGDRPGVQRRLTDELAAQLAAFKTFAESLRQGRRLQAAPPGTALPPRNWRIVERAPGAGSAMQAAPRRGAA